MKQGTQYAEALRAIGHAAEIKHARTEAAHAAVGAVLSLVGARRIAAALIVEPESAQDRLLLLKLAQIEADTVKLDGIPVRQEKAQVRRVVWAQITSGLLAVQAILDRERAVEFVREAVTEKLDGTTG